MIKLCIDAMGGDNGTPTIVEACLQAIFDYPQLDLTLYGDEEEIKGLIKGELYDPSRTHICHCTESITNDEAPVMAIRRKKDSSIVKALTAVANDEADGFVGSGSTGAVLAGATLIVKRLEGIMRPALAPLLPTLPGGQVLLIDCGANVDCLPPWLMQFGMMGSVYMQKLFRMERPRVAILNNGVEAHKGDELVRTAYELLAKAPINFVGSVEAREILSGDVDVVVCDGFVGNVALKSIEGTASMMSKLLKQTIMETTRSKMGGLLLKPAMEGFKKKMDYTEHGGAPLLGLRKCVIKAHGSSNSRAFYQAIRQCQQMATNQVPAMIEASLPEMVAVQGE